MKKSETFRGVLATIGQIICWPAFWFLAYIICDANVENKLKLAKDPKARYIIAANHQSRLDSLVITGVIWPKFWPNLMPYRYITANQFLYNWDLMWFLWTLGGFPAYPTEREGWGLDRAKNILLANQTICIFPEGQRSLPKKIDAKRRVAILAKLPNTYVIPIHMNWIIRRRKVKITIGRAYKANNQSATEILNKIYSL